MITNISNIKNTNSLITFAKNNQTSVSRPLEDMNSKSVSEQGQDVKKTKPKKTGLKITAGVVAFGLGIFAVIKGFPLINKGKINDIILNLEKKSRKLANKKNKTKFEIFLDKSIGKTKATVNLYKTMLNLTSLKDVGFKKATDKIPLIGTACNKITKLFENISIKTVEKKYRKTHKAFNQLYAAFYNANDTLLKSDASKFEKEVSKLRENINKNFGTEEVNFRLNNLRESFKGLGEKIWDSTYRTPKQFFSSRGAYTNCLAEQFSAVEKNSNLQQINELRASISNTSRSKTNYIKELVTNINSVLDPFSDDTINAMKKFDESLKKFHKMNSLENQKTLIENINDLNKLVPDESIRESFAKHINSLGLSKEGQLQELLAKYKNVLTKNEYTKLEKIAQKAINSLDKSANVETVKLFEKMRDLEIGSAPTDVVSIISALAAVGMGLATAESKDERISAALKYGIPAAGAVTVSMICATSLVAAGPSLAVGLISGLAINKIGEFADKIRKTLSNGIYIPKDNCKK